MAWVHMLAPSTAGVPWSASFPGVDRRGRRNGYGGGGKGRGPGVVALATARPTSKRRSRSSSDDMSSRMSSVVLAASASPVVTTVSALSEPRRDASVGLAGSDKGAPRITVPAAAGRAGQFGGGGGALAGGSLFATSQCSSSARAISRVSTGLRAIACLRARRKEMDGRGVRSQDGHQQPPSLAGSDDKRVFEDVRRKRYFRSNNNAKPHKVATFAI